MSNDYPKQVQLKNGQILTVRRPELEDAKELLEYLNLVAGESDNLLYGPGEIKLTVEQEKEYIINTNNNERTLMLLGLINGKIISSARINSESNARIAHNSEVGIAVRKAYWGIGIGNVIMQELIQFAQQHPRIKNVSLGVRADNKTAIRLYEKCGFKKIGEHQHYFHINGQFFNEILMDLQVK